MTQLHTSRKHEHKCVDSFIHTKNVSSSHPIQYSTLVLLGLAVLNKQSEPYLRDTQHLAAWHGNYSHIKPQEEKLKLILQYSDTGIEVGDSVFYILQFGLRLSYEGPVDEQEGNTLHRFVVVQDFPCKGSLVCCGATCAGHTYSCWKGAVILFHKHVHYHLQKPLCKMVSHSSTGQ